MQIKYNHKERKGIAEEKKISQIFPDHVGKLIWMLKLIWQCSHNRNTELKYVYFNSEIHQWFSNTFYYEKENLLCFISSE